MDFLFSVERQRHKWIFKVIFKWKTLLIRLIRKWKDSIRKKAYKKDSDLELKRIWINSNERNEYYHFFFLSIQSINPKGIPNVWFQILGIQE